MEDLEKMALDAASKDERMWELEDLIVSEDGEILDEGEESDVDDGEEGLLDQEPASQGTAKHRG